MLFPHLAVGQHCLAVSHLLSFASSFQVHNEKVLMPTQREVCTALQTTYHKYHILPYECIGSLQSALEALGQLLLPPETR